MLRLPTLLFLIATAARVGNAQSVRDALKQLVFENEGLTTSDMEFTTIHEPCSYLEPEWPALAERAWAQEGQCKYLYRSTAKHNEPPTCKVGPATQGMDRPGDDSEQLVVPDAAKDPVEWCAKACCASNDCLAYVYDVAPKAFGGCKEGQQCCYLKSAVPEAEPCTGCSSGTVDRPPPEVAAPPLGMRSAPPLGGWTTGSMELRADGSFREVTILNQSPADNPKWGRQDGFSVAIAVSSGDKNRTAASMQTHPPPGVPGVSALRFSGAYPVTRLTVADNKDSFQEDGGGLPEGTELYAFGNVQIGSLQASALPGVSLAALSPNEADTMELMVTVPLAEQGLSRLRGGVVLANASTASTPTACLAACNANAACQSWTLINTSGCTLLANAPPPLPLEGAWSGTPVVVTSSTDSSCCAVVDKRAPGSMSGQIAACVSSCGLGVVTGTLDRVTSAFVAGSSVDSAGDDAGIPVAAVFGSPSQGFAKGAITWNFPNRTHTGEVIGNLYATSNSALGTAQKILNYGAMTNVLQNINRWQDALRPPHMPLAIRDSVLQMMNHFRMPIWTFDKRLRSFEAYDCVNIDSVHNDGERSVPYLVAMPEFAVSKLDAWAASQLPDGMIQEQLGCGCTGKVPPLDDVGCGRNMSDVSSMFLVYLVQLSQGGYVDQINRLWPNAVAAAKWQIAQSKELGVPRKLQTTYDVLGLNAYDTCTYSSLFHILAMRSCSFLAERMSDTEMKQECDAATVRAQAALDARHWVEDGGPPPAGAPSGPGPWPMYRSYCDGGSETECPLGAVNATMADSTYPQVLAYTMGFGSLVANETRLRLHLKTIMQRHTTPYGLLIMVGRELPYPGTDRDNAVWMMASPNWVSLALASGLVPPNDLSTAWPTLERSLSWWRGNDTGAGGAGATGVASRNAGGLNDLWNIAGVTGGVNNANTGAPWITSHYGYALTAWRVYMAMSGQAVDLQTGEWSFAPKPGLGNAEGSWPVMMVGGLCKLTITKTTDGLMTAELSVAASSRTFRVNSLRIGEHVCAIQPKSIGAGASVKCRYSVQ